MGVLFWVGLGVLIGMHAGQKKGFGLLYGAIGGALLGPFLAWLMYFAKPAGGAGSSRRRCPNCDEWISAQAKVCPKCQRDVVAPSAARAPVLGYGSGMKR